MQLVITLDDEIERFIGAAAYVEQRVWEPRPAGTVGHDDPRPFPRLMRHVRSVIARSEHDLFHGTVRLEYFFSLVNGGALAGRARSLIVGWHRLDDEAQGLGREIAHLAGLQRLEQALG